MANNYTQFSEVMEGLTPEQVEWIETVLGLDVEDFDDADQGLAALGDLLGLKLEEVKQKDLEWWPGFEWEVKGAEECRLWIHCDEGYQESCLIAFFQAYFRKFDPEGVFKVSMAHTCSRPRANEFGGGWLVITKDEVKGGNTWDAAEDALKELKDGKPQGPT